MKPVVHIVDDDESYCTATARLLSAYGFAVEVYESGVDLLKNCNRLENAHG